MFASLWPAGGVLHFHPDNVCSEDLDKVSMKHDRRLQPVLWFRRWIGFVYHCACINSLPLSVAFFFPWLTISPVPPPPIPSCADGGKPKPEKAASFSAAHVGFKLCPSLYSFLSNSSLGASTQSQTTPALHGREMPHAPPEQAQVRLCHQCSLHTLDANTCDLVFHNSRCK